MNRSDEEIAQKVSQKDLGEAVSDLFGTVGLDFIIEAMTTFFRRLWYDPADRKQLEVERVTQG